MCKWLSFLQKFNNFLFQLFGDKEFVIEIQLFINTRRSEDDIVDVSEVLTDEGFVQ